MEKHTKQRPTKHLDNLLAALDGVGAGGDDCTVGAIGRVGGGIACAVAVRDDAVIGGMGRAVCVKVAAGAHVSGVDVHGDARVWVLDHCVLAVSGSEGRYGHARRRDDDERRQPAPSPKIVHRLFDASCPRPHAFTGSGRPGQPIAGPVRAGPCCDRPGAPLASAWAASLPLLSPLRTRQALESHAEAA